MATSTTKKPTTRKPAARRASVPAPEKAASSATAVDALTADHGYTVGQVHEVDPKTLVVGANVRADVGLTPGFLADVREHGVEVPIDVYVDTLGRLVVEEGQRRTLAAVETGRARVPVRVVQQPGDDADRIIRQDRLNHHRASLVAADQAGVFEQLALLGRTAESIAKSTGHDLTEVEAGLRVAASKGAREATEAPGISLTDAAVVAEFDDDAEAVEELVRVLRDEPAQFGHVVQEFRETRAEEAVVAAKRAELEPFMVLLDEIPSYADQSIGMLSMLKATAGGENLDEDNHADCPGHTAYVGSRPRWVEGVRDGYEAWVNFYCSQWKQQGHVNRHAGPSSGATSGPQSEEQKAERRQLVENNKKSDAAAIVREKWLRELFQRKDLPKDALQATAELFAHMPSPETGDRELQSAWTGVPVGYGEQDATVRATSTPAKASRWLLGWALARVEMTMRGQQGRQWWRPEAAYRRAVQVAYLTRLASWGYPLSDLEQGVVDAASKSGKGK